MNIDEENRAAAYRKQQAARLRWQQANEIRLRGSATARRALSLAWLPVYQKQRERFAAPAVYDPLVQVGTPDNADTE